MAAISKTIEPYYSIADPTAIPLYAGPLIYPPGRGKPAEQADGMVSLRLAPTPRVLVRAANNRQLNVMF